MKKILAPLVIGSVCIIAGTVLALKLLIPKPTPLPQANLTSAIRIGLSLGTLREERWQRDRDLFVAAAEKQGAFVQVLSANSDAELQNSQIDNFIKQRINTIVVVPHDGELAATMIEEAHKANIKIIAYDRMIKNSDLDYYISFDNVKVGKMEAEGVVNVINKGNFAYIGGSPTDNNAFLLKEGSMQVLNPLIQNGSVKLVVDAFMADWKPEEAYKTIKEYLAGGGTLDAIIAANDGTAFGAINALKEFGLDGKIPVSGQDAELSACQRIVQGTQTLTVYKPISALAQKAADIAISMAKGVVPQSNSTVTNGKIDVPSYLLEPIMVTKETMDATIIKDGYHTRDQVYNSK